MKVPKIGTLLVFSLIAVILIILYGLHLEKNAVVIGDDIHPDVGEVWEHYPDGGNPFKRVKVRTVIDIKGIFIQYVEDQDTIVEHDYEFIPWSKRIK